MKQTLHAKLRQVARKGNKKLYKIWPRSTYHCCIPYSGQAIYVRRFHRGMMVYVPAKKL
jgi:hypothetical protein